MRRSRIIAFLVLILILLFGSWAGIFLLGSQTDPSETPVMPVETESGSSLNLTLILVVAGVLVILLLVIGIIISRAKSNSFEEYLGRYDDRKVRIENIQTNNNARMSGDPSTDAPPPDDRKK
ncbi:MAG: hypothetical protein RBS68_02265 [Anaerolineales bacterium]|jgi:hypothetical protein|nr:hypothetical protein [Anaerolineales bacterium]